jgi:hypothetical protein
MNNPCYWFYWLILWNASVENMFGQWGQWPERKEDE